MKRKAQGSLEYIILIAGVVIIAAAAYFLVKGFMVSSRSEVNQTIVESANATRDELNTLENEFGG